MYYKLIDAITIPLTLSVATRQNGYTRYARIRLEPGKKYEIPEDEVLFNSLKGVTEKKRYSAELENALRSCNAQYEIVMCPTCGGRVQKIEYHVVEVVA